MEELLDIADLHLQIRFRIHFDTKIENEANLEEIYGHFKVKINQNEKKKLTLNSFGVVMLKVDLEMGTATRIAKSCDKRTFLSTFGATWKWFVSSCKSIIPMSKKDNAET